MSHQPTLYQENFWHNSTLMMKYKEFFVTDFDHLIQSRKSLHLIGFLFLFH